MLKLVQICCSYDLFFSYYIFLYHGATLFLFFCQDKKKKLNVVNWKNLGETIVPMVLHVLLPLSTAFMVRWRGSEKEENKEKEKTNIMSFSLFSKREIERKIEGNIFLPSTFPRIKILNFSILYFHFNNQTVLYHAN